MDTIAPGIHQLSLGSHGFLVDGDVGVTLVDTGVPGREGRVADGLAEIGRTWDDLTSIVITHAHMDHVGSAAAIKQQAGHASLAMSEVDARVARGDDPAVPPPIFARPPVSWLFRFLPSAPAVEVDHLVGAGQSTGLPADLTVIDTPGHTPGHVSFLLDRHGGVCFVGDAAVATRTGGVARGPMNASTPTFDASLRNLADHDFAIAAFGHSRPLARDATAAFRSFANGLDGR